MYRFFLSLFLFAGFHATAQRLTALQVAALRTEEDSLKVYGKKMIMDRTATERFIADSVFIRGLVKSLKTPNSFYYPYDSLETISRLYAPDSSFRIFSWQFSRDDDYYRQRGAIQVRTDDGSLKLFPLIDMSDFTTAPQDSVRTGQTWIGAIYYKIIKKTFDGKSYYTLLGYDDNNMRSTKKWIEVVHFDDNGKPVFGGHYFNLAGGDSIMQTMSDRYCMEYKKDGRARMNYDPELDMIMLDHLVSESNEPSRLYTLVPDGDYQGLKWVNGKWTLVDKVFNYKLHDGQAPVPEPLKDENGASNEQKLQQQSEKNRQKKQPKPTPQQPAKKPAPQAGDDNSY